MKNKNRLKINEISDYYLVTAPKRCKLELVNGLQSRLHLLFTIPIYTMAPSQTEFGQRILEQRFRPFHNPGQNHNEES